jgi:hypothetical protein
MRRFYERCFAVVCAALATSVAWAQPELLWIEQFGTIDADYSKAAASGSAGGVFVAGYTHGPEGDGGPNEGDFDALLAYHDATGHQAWVTYFGTPEWDFAHAVASDDAGGVFVAGETSGDLGGPNAGHWDAFLIRYDVAGSQIWTRQFGASDTDIARALTPDGAGGVFVAGTTLGDLGGPNAGGADVLLARCDPAGNLTWIKQFGTNSDDQAFALAPDIAGGVFVAGITQGGLGGPYAGSLDVFIAHHDSQGNQTWVTQLGTSEYDFGHALAPDGMGGAFVTGTTNGSLGGPNSGDTDVFLARYDAEGGLVWITQFGTSDGQNAHALASDGAGGVFVAGGAWGNLGGLNAGISDVYVARYNAAGQQTWITQFGTSSSEQAYGLAPNGLGGVFVAGPTNGHLGGPNAGHEDVFLARFATPCYPDLDGNGALDLFDFFAFFNLFSAADEAADCDGSGGMDLFDFLCFVNAFNDGC